MAIEPDLQNFIGFVLESVNKLGGNPFASSIASLDLMQKLRNAGAGTGFPLPASLVLQENLVIVQWEAKNGYTPSANPGSASPTRTQPRADSSLKIAKLAQPPRPEDVAQLRRHLQNSTASADPAILLQRNAEMVRHLDETRARTEKELEALQQALEKRQTELYESLRQAETDALTGLFNRRAFDEKLGRAFRHTMRQRTEPLSLAFFDLDHFKEINDEFGHQFGDAYLNKMAHALRCVIREDVDYAFRFGGDEFALMIFADHRTACHKATKVLRLMEHKVSIGITTINSETPDGLPLEEFIHRADNALYEAKRSGRGRAVIELCPMADNTACQFPCPNITDPDDA